MFQRMRVKETYWDVPCLIDNIFIQVEHFLLETSLYNNLVFVYFVGYKQTNTNSYHYFYKLNGMRNQYICIRIN